MTRTSVPKPSWSDELLIRTVTGEDGGGRRAMQMTGGRVHTPGNGANGVSDPIGGMSPLEEQWLAAQPACQTDNDDALAGAVT